MRLKDRVAIVTGGASDMGFTIASKFANEGAKVAIIDIAGDKAEEAAQKIRSEGRSHSISGGRNFTRKGTGGRFEHT